MDFNPKLDQKKNIKETHQKSKQKYPNKKIVAIHLPNTYSRTKDFKDEFIDSFKIADKTYLTEIDNINYSLYSHNPLF